jgi:uncharacterized peroxidase-related enzyme
VTFIETVPEDQATAAVEEMYEAVRGAYGHVTNFAAAFSLRPEVLGAWMKLNGAIKANMDLRRYELATLVAARRLRSSYCALAHGTVLADEYLRAGEELRAIASDHRAAGLDAADVAVMDFAEQVVDDASAITAQDVGHLRELGLSDAEIFDVALAAAARCFFSKTLDALGVQPDGKFSALDPGLREALVVGRPIAEA